MRLVPYPTLRAQIEAILAAWGMPEETRGISADAMAETDLMGVDSHGISMLPMYETLRRNGTLRLDAVPRLLRETPAAAVLDAGGGLGHPAAAMAMDLAVAKATSVGIGAVGVVNSHHFGAAGWYARRAAAAGCCGIAVSSARGVLVVPTGGAEAMLGTNPIAFAAPLPDGPPFCLDMATSATAANKVKVHALTGKPLPPGWVVDGAGRPITDAAAAWASIGGAVSAGRRPEGGLTPLGGATTETGGHKGYGLAVMVQILAATLLGAPFPPLHHARRAPGEGDALGHLLVAFSPAAFAGGQEIFARGMAELAGALRATRPADPARPVLIPGDPEAEAMARRRAEGIPVPDTLVEQIRAVAARAGAAVLF
ncbi:MAG: Ldh family oxidoreductase [Acetobacteraceae bacterium]|nr:Ldh family oxidoreductase [Acetobacteraceae bacterium]